MAPGGAGGARNGRRIVSMQTGRHGYCMRLGIYGDTDGSEDTARLKFQGEYPSAVFRQFLSFGFPLLLIRSAPSR